MRIPLRRAWSSIGVRPRVCMWVLRPLQCSFSSTVNSLFACLHPCLERLGFEIRQPHSTMPTISLLLLQFYLAFLNEEAGGPVSRASTMRRSLWVHSKTSSLFFGLIRGMSESFL